MQQSAALYLRFIDEKPKDQKESPLIWHSNLKQKNFDVQPGHILCHQCITAYKNIINAHSSDTEVEETPMDDTDEDGLDDTTYKVYETPRKCFNTSLEMACF